MSLTSEQLKRWQAICDAASSGPWGISVQDETKQHIRIHNDMDAEPMECFIDSLHFISESRTAMPELIACVEDLQLSNELIRKTLAIETRRAEEWLSCHLKLEEARAALVFIATDGNMKNRGYLGSRSELVNAAKEALEKINDKG